MFAACIYYLPVWLIRFGKPWAIVNVVNKLPRYSSRAMRRFIGSTGIRYAESLPYTSSDVE